MQTNLLGDNSEQDTPITDALNEALDKGDFKPGDQPLMQLAKAYASAIDWPEGGGKDPLPKLGPQLLACLDRLLLTPKARGAGSKKQSEETTESPLDELRRKRNERKSS